MKGIIFTYKGLVMKVDTTSDNTCIYDSYRIKRVSDMRGVLLRTQGLVSEDMAIYKRSINSMIREWRVHNLLYSLGIQKDRTKDVDLNINQPWYVRLAYTIISPLYLHFS